MTTYVHAQYVQNNCMGYILKKLRTKTKNKLNFHVKPGFRIFNYQLSKV